MTIRRTIAGVANQGFLPIESSPTLQSRVDAHPRSLPGSITADIALEPGLSVRGIDVLLEVARATPFAAEEPLRSIGQSWAVLKYLGVFDVPSPEHRLTVTTSAVRGNARRLLSEELGIGFARSVARRFLAAHVPNLSSVRIEDVDHVDPDSELGEFLDFHGSHRPDYFLVASDPRRPSGFEIFVLEAKGTISKANAISQLARASHQVRSVIVDGAVPDGLACSTVLNPEELFSAALRVSPGFEEAPRAIQTEVDPTGISESVESPADVRSRVRTSERTVATSLVSSWMRLGRLAGDESVERSWSSLLPAEFVSASRTAGAPRSRMDVDGETASGAISTIETPIGRIEAFLGVNDRVLEALRTGRDDAVLEAQAEFALRYAARNGVANSEGEASTADQEGAVLRIAVLD